MNEIQFVFDRNKGNRVKDKWTGDLKRMCEVNLDLKCTTDQTRGGRGSVGIWT